LPVASVASVVANPVSLAPLSMANHKFQRFVLWEAPHGMPNNMVVDTATTMVFALITTTISNTNTSSKRQTETDL